MRRNDLYLYLAPALAGTLMACSNGDDGGQGGTGFETGPCIDGIVCAAGLQCVAQYCIAGDEGEEGSAEGTGDGEGDGDGDGDGEGPGDTSTSGDGDGDGETSTASSTDESSSGSTDDTGTSTGTSTTTGGGDYGNCGWSEADSWYACGFMGEDPSNTYPIECPGGLVEGDPDCQAQIGFEGCCTPQGVAWYCSMEDTFIQEDCG
jgi:hypothetical protein